MLKRVLEPKRDEVTGWRRLHNEDLYKIFTTLGSKNGCPCGKHGEIRNTYNA
jgi:hypothetical protein